MRMIIDSHAHIATPKHAALPILETWFEPFGLNPRVFYRTAEDVAAQMVAANVDRTILLAFDAERGMNIHVPNEFVAHVASTAENVIPFASVDPMRTDALQLMDIAFERMHMEGLKLAPTYQWFDPICREAFQIYEYCAERSIPILIHQGPSVNKYSAAQYQDVGVIDVIAEAFPSLRIIVAHLSGGVDGRLIATMRRNSNVYMDTSGVDCEGFGLPAAKLSQLLLTFKLEGLIDRICWGSDAPWSQPVNSLIYVLAACKSAGYERNEIEGVLGGNVLRFLSGASGRER